MARIEFGQGNQQSPTPEGPTRAAVDALSQEGFCVLDGVLPTDLVAELRQEFFERYGREMVKRSAADVLTVGDRRFMFTVELSGPFGSPTVYANPYLLSVIRRTLGADCVLDSFGVVASLPGAEQQHMHRDGSPLFPGPLAGMLPVYAITVVLPLVEMNDNHGTTALEAGTHRYKEAGVEPQTPIVPEGSAVLWDYRLVHGGTPNRSIITRPIIYLTYARKWWRDADNFKSNGQRRLAFSTEWLTSVPADAIHLFAQA